MMNWIARDLGHHCWGCLTRSVSLWWRDRPWRWERLADERKNVISYVLAAGILVIVVVGLLALFAFLVNGVLG